MRALCPRLLVAAMVIVLAACSGSSGTEDTAAATVDDSASASIESAASESNEPESGEPQTLDDYLGGAASFVRGDGGRGAGTSDDERIEQQRLIEEAVQRCMQNQGFEYTQREADGGVQVLLGSADAGLSPEDYAATEGFGISTRFDALLDNEVDLGDEATPNEDYIATLSPGEADAYEVALNGEPPVRNDQGQLIDPETGEVLQGGRGPGQRVAGGCRGEAQLEVRGDFTAIFELAEAYDELEESIASDPRMIELSRSWIECMADGGYTYDDETEARAEIREEFRPLLRSFLANSRGEGQGEGQGDGQGQGGGGNRLQAVASLDLTEEQEQELAQLQDRERAVAVASLACQAGDEAEITEIAARYEAEFIAANRALLESLS